MKRFVLALVTLLFTVYSFAISSWPIDSWPIAFWPNTFTQTLSKENAANDDEWVLVGEVRLFRGSYPNYE